MLPVATRIGRSQAQSTALMYRTHLSRWIIVAVCINLFRWSAMLWPVTTCPDGALLYTVPTCQDGVVCCDLYPPLQVEHYPPVQREWACCDMHPLAQTECCFASCTHLSRRSAMLRCLQQLVGSTQQHVLHSLKGTPLHRVCVQLCVNYLKAGGTAWLHAATRNHFMLAILYDLHVARLPHDLHVNNLSHDLQVANLLHDLHIDSNLSHETSCS